MRLFVALDIPEAVRQQLRGLIERLSKVCPGVRWVRPEGIHVTLKFIGHVDAAKCEAIRVALDPLRSEQSVEMRFYGLGFFPNGARPRVAWCGVESTPNLAELATEINEAVARLGVEREKRAYMPHLTLARIDAEKVRRAAIERLVGAAMEFAGASFGSASENEFHLYESVTKPSGAEYKKLQSFAFVKRPA